MDIQTADGTVEYVMKQPTCCCGQMVDRCGLGMGKCLGGWQPPVGFFDGDTEKGRVTNLVRLMSCGVLCKYPQRFRLSDCIVGYSDSVFFTCASLFCRLLPQVGAVESRLTGQMAMFYDTKGMQIKIPRGSSPAGTARILAGFFLSQETML